MYGLVGSFLKPQFLYLENGESHSPWCLAQSRCSGMKAIASRQEAELWFSPHPCPFRKAPCCWFILQEAGTVTSLETSASLKGGHFSKLVIKSCISRLEGTWRSRTPMWIYSRMRLWGLISTSDLLNTSGCRSRASPTYLTWSPLPVQRHHPCSLPGGRVEAWSWDQVTGLTMELLNYKVFLEEG